MNLIEHIKNGGKVQTRDGREVRVISTEGTEKFPIVVIVGNSLTTHTATGSYHLVNEKSPSDLIPVPERRVAWVHVYKTTDGCFVYGTKESAVKHSDPSCIARIRIEYTEGQFDE